MRKGMKKAGHGWIDFARERMAFNEEATGISTADLGRYR
jgi:hypothetical protein